MILEKIMNWTVKSEKRGRIYELLLSIEKKGEWRPPGLGSLLEVRVTVPKENPRGIRPVGWHESEIRNMLKEKG